MKSNPWRLPVITLSLLASAALLSACDRPGSADGQSGTSGTGSQTERSSGRSSGSDSQSGTSGTTGIGGSAREAGRDAKEGMGSAADAVANKSKDMAITAAVNARLAGDERLSALNINVDTVGGRVVLRGTAPDTAARARAAELARSVDGVGEVNNELSVQPSR